MKLKIDYIIDEIMETWHEEICYYNTITHQMLHHKLNEENSEIYIDFCLNKDAFIQVPTMEDLNIFGIFDDFMLTIKDKDLRATIIEYVEESYDDFYDDLSRFHLHEQWQNFYENACVNFAVEWCEENNLDYEL